MTTMRGERFHINLDVDSEDRADTLPFSQKKPIVPDLNFIRDVIEHTPSEAHYPSPPTLKNSHTGFPAHKKRPRLSHFKRRCESASAPKIAKAVANTPRNVPHPQEAASPYAHTRRGSNSAISAFDRKQIDEENNQRLKDMSPQQIEAERQELLDSLSQSTIERLLRRAKVDSDQTGESKYSLPTQRSEDNIETLLKRANIDEDYVNTTESSLQMPPPDNLQKENVGNEKGLEENIQSGKRVTFTEDQNRTPPPSSRSDLLTVPASLSSEPLTPIKPKAPLPSLDPSSPNFLSTLHETYFPSLPQNPSTLSWLSPLPENDPSSPYHPSQTSFPVVSLRFDFNGLLLPPALAQQIPVTKGLHHHGIAPEAAGYTLEELSMLMRSTVTSQRCIGVQTSGRILYRLGRGDFGHLGNIDGEDDEEDGGETLCRGMWDLMERLKVIDMLIVEANKEEGKGSRTLSALAVEAVWLWQRGGGNRGVVRAQ